MNTSLWKKMLLKSAEEFIRNITYLCEIDGATGDGDHGITIGKIGDAIKKRCTEFIQDDSIKKINDDLSMLLMNINGGSAGPLYGTIFEGMADSIQGNADITIEELKNMFKNAKEEFGMISKAEIGDKTMVDALYPAIDAIQVTDGDIFEIFNNAAIAAISGAENTKEMIAKYGRAKNLGERGIGHLDPGAVSVSLFFRGLYKGLE